MTFNHGCLPILATPLLICDFEKHEQYSKRFHNFEKVDRKPEGWHVSINTSFPNVLENDSYIDRSLVSDLKKDLYRQVQKLLQSYKLQDSIFFESFWYNASYAGQGQEIHNHCAVNNLHPYWSGIYFAKNVTYDSFSFTRTDVSLKSQQPADYLNSALVPYYLDWEHIPCSNKNMNKIIDGTIILFPPHVYHSVKTPDYNTKDRMRLSFSFNISLNIELNADYDPPVGGGSYKRRYHMSHTYKKGFKNGR